MKNHELCVSGDNPDEYRCVKGIYEKNFWMEMNRQKQKRAQVKQAVKTGKEA